MAPTMLRDCLAQLDAEEQLIDELAVEFFAAKAVLALRRKRRDILRDYLTSIGALGGGGTDGER